MNRFDGKVAIVTGGTSGIGKATVEAFVAEGATTVFTGRNEEAGRTIASACGERAVFLRADIMEEADIEMVARFVEERYGRLDVLFNNAGSLTPGDPENVTVEQFDYAMALLLRSVLLGTRHAVPIMKRNGRGAIINNASVAAHRTDLEQYLYSIAKAGVSHATKLAAVALGKYGITVNAVSPGGVVAGAFIGGSRGAADLGDEKRDAIVSTLTANIAAINPIKRAGTPEDIAATVLFLASEQGAYITGIDIVVDGGAIAAGNRTARRPPFVD